MQALNVAQVELLLAQVATQFTLLPAAAHTRRKSWLLKSKTPTICNTLLAQRLNAHHLQRE
jgi:hypothetical protein